MPEVIEYFNRYTGRVETEEIYGEAWLRWTYGTPLGRLSARQLSKRALFSRWYGWRMSHENSRAKIQPFIEAYKLDPAQFADPVESYKSFNEFFHRKLKPEARPVNSDPAVVVFPADGRHLGFQDVSKADGIFVKAQKFDLDELVGNRGLAARYRTGTMVLSRLCPVDYHRFHFPVGGVPDAPKLIPGELYSVNPIALRRNIHIFTQNKRAVCRIETERLGMVLMFEIGATCVGAFEYTYTPGHPVEKGAEKGYFKFGGSSIITLFEPARIRLDGDLLENSRQRRELYAHVGDRMGMATGSAADEPQH